MSLHDDILDECDQCRLVSFERLERLMTKERVSNHLNSHDILLDAEILEKVLDKGRRLFALLVLLSCETIANCVFKRFHDDMLPFATMEDVPEEVGDGHQRRKLLHFQRSFFPKLTCANPPQEFPRSTKLPLAKRLKQPQGHGTFGVLYKVKIVRGYFSGYPLRDLPWMAWKEIQTTREQDWNNVLNEVRTLKARKHENIVPLMACFSAEAAASWPKVLNLFFPWADMDMQLWLKQDRNPDPKNRVYDLDKPEPRKKYLYDSMLSLLDALSHLHRDIGGEVALHLDLKPENILLFDSTWKLSDFGKSRLEYLTTGSETEGKDGLGSPRYQPPEYSDRTVHKYGRSFDIWAMACIFMELAIILVHGWETQEHHKFELESSNENPKFCNNMDVVRRWINKLEDEDGSPNFRFLMQTIGAMFSDVPEARPCSWEVQLDLEEQFRPNNTASARRERMKELVQQPKLTQRIGKHNPVARAVARSNSKRVEYLLDAGWLPDEYDSQDVERYFEGYKPSTSQIQQLFIRAFKSYERAFPWRADFADSIQAAELKDFSYCDIKRFLELDNGFKNSPDVVKLLSKEMYVNQKNDEKGDTLFSAARYGNAVAVKLLLSQGNAPHINFQSKSEGTPLIAASKHGHARVVRILCENKWVHINAQDSATRRTALSWAAQHDHFDVVKLLLEQKADAELSDIHGRTPFSIAAQWSSKEIVKLFFEFRAESTTRDENGFGPLTHAKAELQHLEYKEDSIDRIRNRRSVVKKLEAIDSSDPKAVEQLLQQRNREDPRR